MSEDGATTPTINEAVSKDTDRDARRAQDPPEESSPAGLDGIAAAEFVMDVHDNELHDMDSCMKRGARVGVALWLVLLLVAYLIAPTEILAPGHELMATLTVCIVLFVTNMTRIIPLRVVVEATNKWTSSGIMHGSCATQAISFMSAALITYLPTPVLTDHATGQRIRLIRWAEWTALAFTTTFLATTLEMPDQSSSVQRIWTHSCALAASAMFGLIALVCHAHANNAALAASSGLSLVCFSSIYFRLYRRHQLFAGLDNAKTCVVSDQDTYNRIRLSLRLVQASALVCTSLIVGRLVYMFAPFRTTESCVKDPLFLVVLETSFEILSKVMYLRLYDEIHRDVFDDKSRAIRRLQELRKLMNVVWETSTDIICISVESASLTRSSSSLQGQIHALISPTLLKCWKNKQMGMMRREQDEEDMYRTRRPPMALLVELDRNCANDEDQAMRIFSMDFSAPGGTGSGTIVKELSKTNAFMMSEMRTSISSMLAKAWKCTSRKCSFVHELGSATKESDDHILRFEAQVTRMSNDVLVVVLRDISERCKTFETEKKVLAEVVERKKDAEANRFTRHEVKNGLLAAIGLVDSARDSLGFQRESPQGIPRSQSSASLATSDSSNQNAFDATHTMNELDATLREILNTVLSEAMVRDVVHDAYALKQERVDVKELLSGHRNQKSRNSERFPLLLEPNAFPQIIVDPQLLRFIHQGAVSNSIKYGQLGGVIETAVCYEASSKALRLIVKNEPGEFHDELTTLTDEEAATVFESGARLHRLRKTSIDSAEVSQPSGSGGWIMQKCATLLRGHCSIEFQESCTVFTLLCSGVECHTYAAKRSKRAGKRQFKLPDSTWGIAIDDSGIQRRILNKFFALAGIKSSKRRVLGKDCSEVMGFNKFLVKTIRSHPNDNFLVIVDENLDVVDGKTFSGSMCVKGVLDELSEEEENQVLALVRSANDSCDDIVLYESRAHGFLPKAPMKKDSVLDLIQPWWDLRFDSYGFNTGDDSSGDESCETGVIPSREDMIRSIETLNMLLKSCDKAVLAARWPAIREKIHALGGDLKTMKWSSQVLSVLESMGKLTGDDPPDELQERWRLIRSVILSII